MSRVQVSLQGAILLLGIAVGAGGIRADVLVYDNDFNFQAGSTFSEWLSSPITYFNTSTPKDGTQIDAPAVTNVESPNGKEHYLGPFGGPRLADDTKDFNRTRVEQTISLKLARLPEHKSITVAFDLYILNSWDGNNANYGPDRWKLAVADGPTLLETTFSNNPKTGAYDLSNQDFPRKNSKFQMNAAAVNTLGSKFFGDAIYSLKYTFNHSADELELRFSSDLFEGKGTDDEGWRLDNVQVTANENETKTKALNKPAQKAK